MNFEYLNRAVFLMEHADVPRALPPQTPVADPLHTAAVLEHQILLAFLAGFLFGKSDCAHYS